MTTNLQTYNNYKPSGVEWLGDIPEHWEITSIKHILEIPISDGPHTTPELFDEGIPFISAEAIKNGKIDFKKKRGYISLKDHLLFSKKYSPKWNDIYMVKSGATTGNIAMVKTDKEFSIWSPLAVFRANQNKIIPSFLYNYLQSVSLKKGVELNWSFGTQQNIGMGVLSNLMIPYPTISEQTTIANFLDDKTVKIDQAIGIKQKQIELLKEHRDILIHKAVTRGLNDTVKLKDSGVDWIGEIPEHWEVKKLFGLCNFIRGNSTFSKDELLCNGDYVALQYGKTYKVDEINDSYSFYVNEEFYKETQIVKYDDTILISTSETIEDLGHSAYYNRNDIGLIGGEQILLNPNNKKVNGHYLYFYSKLFSKELRKYATGIKVFRFNVNNLKTIYISFPPLSEQEEIVKFIETVTTKITTAISLKKQEIEKLKEYKMSLINSVVTGKVKVF